MKPSRACLHQPFPQMFPSTRLNPVRVLLDHVAPKKDYQRWSSALTRNFHSSPPSLKKKMPPKKAAAPEKKILLGRPSNNLKIGIVGTWQPLPCLLLISFPSQACQMSENPHSSTCYLTQVRFASRRSAPSDDPLRRS
jgi:hypothetical protein